MQAVLAVAGAELIVDAVQRETALIDAIGEAADRDADIGRLVEIGRQRVVAQDDVGHRPLAIGQGQGLQGRAIGDNGRRDARAAVERGAGNDLAVGQMAKGEDTERRHHPGFTQT